MPLLNANLLAFAYIMGLFPPIPLYYPSSEATLVYFVTHLSNTVSYGTIKVYLAAVKNLHTEFGFPLDFTSMLLLFNTLQGIKCLQSISKQARYPFTITVLQQIYSKLQPFHPQDVDSSILWAAFTLAFFCSLRSIKFTWNGKFDPHTHLSRADINFTPYIFSLNFLEITIKKSKTYPFHETAKLTIAGSSSTSAPSLSCKTINFKHTVRVHPILSSNSLIGAMLPEHRLPTAT